MDLRIIKGSDSMGDEIDNVILVDAGTRKIIESCQKTMLDQNEMICSSM